MVSQEVAVCPHMTVLENVLLGQEPRRFGFLDHKVGVKTAREALGMLASEGEPSWLALDRRVGDLPMAARQLVEIARALVRSVGLRVLILDEPTSSLGKEDTERLFGVIRKLCQTGVTVLYVSHFLEEIRSIADRYTVLRDGATVGTGEMADTTQAGLVQLMVGRSIEQLFVRSARTPGSVVLSVQNLAGLTRPTNATLELRRGEVLGIAGLVGAGRTELLQAIFGLALVRQGQIRVGQWAGPASPVRRLAQGVGMLSEDRKGEGLAGALSDPGQPYPFAAPNRTALQTAIPQTPTTGREQLDPATRHQGAGSVQPVSDLSGGNQQKVALARLLHHGVDVLLLDEPTRGIDVGSKAQIYELMDKLAREGKAVLMVSKLPPGAAGSV